MSFAIADKELMELNSVKLFSSFWVLAAAILPMYSRKTPLVSADVPYVFSLSSSWRHIQPRTGSLEARIQAIEADNQRIVGMCTGSGSMNAPRSTVVSSYTLQYQGFSTTLLG